MQILFGHESWNIDITVLLVEYFYPYKPFSCHNSFHKTEIEAPDHDDSKNDGKRSHNNPILNVVHAENRGVLRIINAIIVFILS